jgi:hypothetical protein
MPKRQVKPAPNTKGRSKYFFCSTCNFEADMALHPGPNVYCRNPGCSMVNKAQVGVYRPEQESKKNEPE